ncbi:UNVERIFIED_CONTAM: 60S ribosomal protein L28-1 [Sesamum latifolium]|uniref:60S ribosomal protein L28-1 n=1 Tax=Sesamum latifolium TaxID=2727402 RepID=A0AAW2YDI6_9LAMI
MATVPGQLIWEIVKKNNSFLVKEFGNGTASVKFSKETNNLYNLHSFKHSGLANKKTVISTWQGPVRAAWNNKDKETEQAR